jgi:hypothetical protein
MRAGLIAAICFGLSLAGCGGDEYAASEEVRVEALEAAPENEFGFMEAMEQGPSPFGGTGRGVEMAAAQAQAAARSEGNTAESAPEPADTAQIAYSYSYGYRVDADQIVELQQRHAALCEKMGVRRCRVLNLSNAASDGEGYGELQLRVAASEARAFGTALDDATEGLDAEQVSFGLDGEDLTESIIDTEAHLGSRRVLRDRLMEVLRTRQGSVADLVAAERAVAEVNEEIDSAASRLAELRNRVRMSAVSIDYGPNIAVSSLGFSRPISTALSSVGSTLGVTIAAIIYIAVALVPVIAFLLLLRWLWRRSGFRIRRNKTTSVEAIEA